MQIRKGKDLAPTTLPLGTIYGAYLLLSAVSKFAKPFTGASREELAKKDVVDLKNPLPEIGAALPFTEALECLADAYEARGQEGVDSAVEFRHNSLPHQP